MSFKKNLTQHLADAVMSQESRGITVISFSTGMVEDCQLDRIQNHLADRQVSEDV